MPSKSSIKYFAIERVVDALNNLSWYLLPIRHQKDIAHILNRAQNGDVLTIGPLAELNYETATNLSTIFYSLLCHFFQLV